MEIMTNSNLTIRTAAESDISTIEIAFREFLGRAANVAYITEAVKNYPSALIFHYDMLIGFSYCGFMAPDVLEIANIALHPQWRNSGIGSDLLAFLEAEIAKEYKAVLLTNSNLYAGKRNAANFYLTNGYSLVAGTCETNLFWKNLSHPDD